MYQQPDPAQIQHIMHAMLPFMAVVALAGTALYIVPFWMIFKKSGLGGPLSLLMLLPIVNIIMLYVLAFSRWKVIPAPEYTAGYPSPYPPAYPAAAYAPPQGYVATQHAAPAYVPPTEPPTI